VYNVSQPKMGVPFRTQALHRGAALQFHFGLGAKPIVFTDVTEGYNGASAGPGWDFASGIGIPDGYGLSNVE